MAKKKTAKKKSAKKKQAKKKPGKKKSPQICRDCRQPKCICDEGPLVPPVHHPAIELPESLAGLPVPDDLEPNALAWLTKSVEEFGADADSIDLFLQLLNAAELLSRADQLKARYKREGIIVAYETGNGWSEKLNPCIAAEKSMRAQFSTVVKQLGLNNEIRD